MHFVAALFAIHTLNRIIGIVSGLSGLTMLGFAVATDNIATGLNGFGAIAVAVLLFQVTDLRERTKRIEAHLFKK